MTDSCVPSCTHEGHLCKRNVGRQAGSYEYKPFIWSQYVTNQTNEEEAPIIQKNQRTDQISLNFPGLLSVLEMLPAAWGYDELIRLN